jgi:hypothetical protein
VNAEWKKSSRSGANQGSCVEVRRCEGTIQVRDTKDNGSGPILNFTPAEWQAFVNGVHGGEFDLNR